jgi:hypothetical protein
MKEARQKLLRSAPLPASRNRLLGRWTIEKKVPIGGGRQDDFSQLLGVLTNMDRLGCQIVLGEGITEFKPASWSSIDSFGDDSLGPIKYVGDGDRVWAVPETGLNFLAFDIVSANRVTMIGFEDCTLVRVGADAPGATANPRAAGPPRAAPNRATTAPTTPPPTPAPTSTASTQPPHEICRQTFLDQLGTAGINPVRQVIERRFTSDTQGQVPGTSLTRITARGSACDDPRLSATWYDFAANGMLQRVTYVWQRPSGPLPSPMFAERINALSRFHPLPSPQSPGHLEADTSLGRLTLQDVPARNELLEAYVAKK